jgi:hypothetical protein
VKLLQIDTPLARLYYLNQNSVISIRKETGMKFAKLGIIFFTAVLLLSLLASCSNTSTATTTTTTPPTPFQTYSETTGLYSISYPQAWELANTMTTLQTQIYAYIVNINAGTPLKLGSTLFVAGLKADVGYYPNVNISVDPAPAGMTTTAQAVQSEVNGLVKTDPNYKELSRENITVNGKTMALLEFQATFTNTGLMHDYIVVYLVKGNIWTLTCTAKDTDFAQLKTDFTRIINSFTLNQ